MVSEKTLKTAGLDPKSIKPMTKEERARLECYLPEDLSMFWFWFPFVLGGIGITVAINFIKVEWMSVITCITIALLTAGCCFAQETINRNRFEIRQLKKEKYAREYLENNADE